MSSSNLIRWGGLVAVIAVVLFVIVDLTCLLLLGFGQSRNEGGLLSNLLYLRFVTAPVAGALLLL